MPSPTSGRSCFLQEFQSQAVPRRRLDLTVARERQLCRCWPQFSCQTSPPRFKRGGSQSSTRPVSGAEPWKAHRSHPGILLCSQIRLRDLQCQGVPAKPFILDPMEFLIRSENEGDSQRVAEVAYLLVVGKNRGGVEPEGIEELTRRVRPDAVVWTGDPHLPRSQQGKKRT